MQTSGACVLFVEDNDVLRRVVSQLLEQDGYTVVQAADAEAAAQRISSGDDHFDAVICDVMHGAMPATGLLQRLRRHRADVPLLMISGHAKEEAELHLGEQGFAFLQKPFTAEDLLDSLHHLCRTTAQSAAYTRGSSMLPAT